MTHNIQFTDSKYIFVIYFLELLIDKKYLDGNLITVF